MSGTSPSEDELVGRVLAGKYRIERRLGEGGMGVVYEATLLDLGRRVAVKTILDVKDPRDVARLHDEALAAAALVHPCIIQVNDFCPATEGTPPFLVMELLVGHPLSRVLARDGRMPVAKAVRIALHLLSALGAAHDARILHRDVKPANVFLMESVDPAEPVVKVVDFGIAKFLDDEARRTTTGKVIGTTAYLAPELLRGAAPSASVDLYAAGICLFEMLTGKRPFDPKRRDLLEAIVREDAPDVRSLEPSVPEAVARVVARALKKKPEERWRTAQEMADALRAATTTSAPSALPPTAPTVTSAVAPAVAPETATATESNRTRTTFAIAVLASIAIGAVAATAFLFVTLVQRTNGGTPDAGATPIAIVPTATTSLAPEAGDSGPAPSASEATPPASASVPAKPAAVPCVCFDQKTYFCQALESSCNCIDSIGVMLMKERCVKEPCEFIHYRGMSPPEERSHCKGNYKNILPDGTMQSPPGEGSYRCSKQCNKPLARAQAVRAIPGTPCSGVAFEAMGQGHGVWRAVSELK